MRHQIRPDAISARKSADPPGSRWPEGPPPLAKNGPGARRTSGELLPGWQLQPGGDRRLRREARPETLPAPCAGHLPVPHCGGPGGGHQVGPDGVRASVDDANWAGRKSVLLPEKQRFSAKGSSGGPPRCSRGPGRKGEGGADGHCGKVGPPGGPVEWLHCGRSCSPAEPRPNEENIPHHARPRRGEPRLARWFQQG